MDLGIKDKTVLVTGASQGIGKDIAIEFAKEGCKVICLARREDKLKDLVQSIGGEEKGHSYFAVDLMEKNAPTEIATTILGKVDIVDIIVHNVGGTLEVKDPLSSVEKWNDVAKFNVGIAIELNNVLVPEMKKQNWGRIVHISSISAINLRGSAAYGASKAYLNAYSTVLGRALAQDGIVVSALMPGAVYAEGGHWDEKSEKNQKDLKEFLRKKKDFLWHHHAVGRLGLSEEIAPFVVFMASKHVTFAQTSIIPIDGGTM